MSGSTYAELIYANINDTYKTVYIEGAVAVNAIKDTCQGEQDSYALSVSTDGKIQFCRAATHRFALKPSKYFHAVIDRPSRELYRSGFSALINFPFLLERDILALPGNDISRYRSEGRIKSLSEVGSPLTAARINQLPLETLQAIIYELFKAIQRDRVEEITIGLPGSHPSAKDCDYDTYLEHSNKFNTLWRSVLTSIYACLPYMLRRKVGYTVCSNASGLSVVELKLICTNMGENVTLVGSTCSNYSDESCYNLARTIIEQFQAGTQALTSYLDTLQSQVECHFTDNNLGAICPQSYIDAINANDELNKMTVAELLADLCQDTTKRQLNTAYRNFLTGAVKARATSADIDAYLRKLFVSCISQENVEGYLKYFAGCVTMLRSVFPSYVLRYDHYLVEINDIKLKTLQEGGSDYQNTLDGLQKWCDALSTFQTLTNADFKHPEGTIALGTCMHALFENASLKLASDLDRQHTAKAEEDAAAIAAQFLSLDDISRATFYNEYGGESAAECIKRAKGLKLYSTLLATGFDTIELYFQLGQECARYIDGFSHSLIEDYCGKVVTLYNKITAIYATTTLAFFADELFDRIDAWPEKLVAAFHKQLRNYAALTPMDSSKLLPYIKNPVARLLFKKTLTSIIESKDTLFYDKDDLSVASISDVEESIREIYRWNMCSGESNLVCIKICSKTFGKETLTIEDTESINPIDQLTALRNFLISPTVDNKVACQFLLSVSTTMPEALVRYHAFDCRHFDCLQKYAQASNAPATYSVILREYAVALINREAPVWETLSFEYIKELFDNYLVPLNDDSTKDPFVRSAVAFFVNNNTTEFLNALPKKNAVRVALEKYIQEQTQRQKQSGRAKLARAEKSSPASSSTHDESVILGGNDDNDDSSTSETAPIPDNEDVDVKPETTVEKSSRLSLFVKSLSFDAIISIVSVVSVLVIIALSLIGIFHSTVAPILKFISLIAFSLSMGGFVGVAINFAIQGSSEQSTLKDSFSKINSKQKFSAKTARTIILSAGIGIFSAALIFLGFVLARPDTLDVFNGVSESDAVTGQQTSTPAVNTEYFPDDGYYSFRNPATQLYLAPTTISGDTQILGTSSSPGYFYVKKFTTTANGVPLDYYTIYSDLEQNQAVQLSATAPSSPTFTIVPCNDITEPCMRLYFVTSNGGDSVTICADRIEGIKEGEVMSLNDDNVVVLGKLSDKADMQSWVVSPMLTQADASLTSLATPTLADHTNRGTYRLYCPSLKKYLSIKEQTTEDGELEYISAMADYQQGSANFEFIIEDAPNGRICIVSIATGKRLSLCVRGSDAQEGAGLKFGENTKDHITFLWDDIVTGSKTCIVYGEDASYGIASDGTELFTSTAGTALLWQLEKINE